MPQEWTKERWDDTLKKIYTRAATDGAFRERCLNDAAAAIREISGQDPAEGVKVRFVEALEEHVLVLPPSLSENEISDEELANVAGGAARASGCDYGGGEGEAETQTIHCPTTACNPKLKTSLKGGGR